MELCEKTVDTSYVFSGKIIKVKVDNVELPNGNEAFREIVEHNGGVCVLPLDDEGNTYLVKQYRYAYREVVTELPAGKREGNEEPMLCGVRELKEEIGAVAKNVVPLGKLYPTPGYCSEIIWLFLATGLDFGDQRLDDDEFLNVEKVPLEKAVDMVMSGEIVDSKTQIALLKAHKMRQDGKI